MEPTPEEREAILAALPPAVRDPRLRGGVASLVIERGDRVLDAAVRLGEPAEVWLRPLPTSDRGALSFFMDLLDRRRGQLAHELSGPATGVLAALETVIDYEPISEGTAGLLRDAREGMIRLTRLADDRGGLWSGEPNVVEEPLGSLLGRCLAGIRSTLDPLGERLDVVIRAAAEPAVRCDALLAEGALCVLVHNAWKFRSGQHARVVVDGAVERGALRLTVEDDGRGVDGGTLSSAGAIGFSTRANGVGLGLFSLRWSARREGAVLVLQHGDPGLRASVFLPMNT